MIVFLVRNYSSQYYISATKFKIALSDLIQDCSLENLVLKGETKSIIKGLNPSSENLEVSGQDILACQKIASDKDLINCLKPYLLPFSKDFYRQKIK